MPSSDKQICAEIADLQPLSRDDLLKQWIKAYGAPPFKGARRSTLIRGIAYHIQCKRLGRLKPSVSRQLLKIAKNEATSSRSLKTSIRSIPKAKLGAQLVREWNGRTHTVHVTDKGYVMNGVTYGSLSAAAKAITGAHWSGPRFFGLISPPTVRRKKGDINEYPQPHV